MTARRFFISLTCVVLLSPLAAETCFSQSAWQELVRQKSTHEFFCCQSSFRNR